MTAPGRSAHHSHSSRHPPRGQVPGSTGRHHGQEEPDQPHRQGLGPQPGHEVGQAEERGDDPHQGERGPQGRTAGRPDAPDQPVDDPQDPDQRAGREGQRDASQHQRHEAIGQGHGARARDRAGQEATDAGRLRGVLGALAGGRRRQPEPGHHDEGVRDEEHEETEGHRGGEDASPALRVALDRLERGVDGCRICPPGLYDRPGVLRRAAEALQPAGGGAAWPGGPSSSDDAGVPSLPPGDRRRLPCRHSGPDRDVAVTPASARPERVLGS